MWDKEIWPPSSPDCKPLEYFVCGVSEFRVNVKPHNETAYWILKIMAVMESLDKDTMAKAFRRFRSISEAVVAADGYFIKYSYSQFVYQLVCFYFNEILPYYAVQKPNP